MPTFLKVSPDALDRLKRRRAQEAREAYPFSQLKVGDAFYISQNEYSQRPNITSPSFNSMRATLKKQAQKYTPKQFHVTRHEDGFLVVRLS